MKNTIIKIIRKSYKYIRFLLIGLWDEILDLFALKTLGVRAEFDYYRLPDDLKPDMPSNWDELVSEYNDLRPDYIIY